MSSSKRIYMHYCIYKQYFREQEKGWKCRASFSLAVRVKQLRNSSTSHCYVTAVNLNLLLKVQTYITCQTIRDNQLQFQNRMQKMLKSYLQS